MKLTEIYTPPHEPHLSVLLDCLPGFRDVAGFPGMTYLGETSAHISLAGHKGLNIPVLAHEAVHAASHLLKLSKLNPLLGVSWDKEVAPTKGAAYEETLAWLVEQIVAGGIRAYDAWQAKHLQVVGQPEKRT